MAATNAERQAAYKAKKEGLLDSLTAQNSLLLEENKNLHSQVKMLTEKLHKQEIAALRAQIKKS
jgi:hypothetical protein